MAIAFVILGSLIYFLETAENYVKIQLKGDNYYVEQSSFDLILKELESFSREEEKKLQSLMENDFKEIDQLIEKNVNQYLDWNYSLSGSFTQSTLMILAASTKIIAGQVSQVDPNKVIALEREIEEHLFNQEIKDSYQNIIKKLAVYQSGISVSIEDHLLKKVKDQGNQLLGSIIHSVKDYRNSKVIIMDDLSKIIQERSLNMGMKKFKYSLGVSIGVIAYVYRKLIVQLSEKLLASTLEKLVIKKAVKTGIKAAAIEGATAGVVCGPYALVCGAAIGLGVFVTSEYASNKMDEYLNREDFKKDLLGIFNQIKMDSIHLILSQLHGFNEVFFSQSQNHDTQKIKMIDLLSSTQKF